MLTRFYPLPEDPMARAAIDKAVGKMRGEYLTTAAHYLYLARVLNNDKIRQHIAHELNEAAEPFCEKFLYRL